MVLAECAQNGNLPYYTTTREVRGKIHAADRSHHMGSGCESSLQTCFTAG